MVFYIRERKWNGNIEYWKVKKRQKRIYEGRAQWIHNAVW